MPTMNPPRNISRGQPGDPAGAQRSPGHAQARYSTRPAMAPTSGTGARDAEVPVSMVDRVSLVLRTFGAAGPMTLAQVTARTGLPRSSVHRLLDQLAQAGWLAKSPGQTYELGVHAYEVGQAALRHNRLLQAAAPVMRTFAHRTGFTIQLGVVDRGDTVYLAKTGGRRSGPTPTAVGQRIPAHLTALGKVLMATPQPADRPGPRGRPVAPFHHPATAFAQEMDEIRRRGAAFDRGEAFSGIGCVGVSIGPADHPYGNLAGLSMSAAVGTFEPRELVGPLRIAAREIWERSVATDLAGD